MRYGRWEDLKPKGVGMAGMNYQNALGTAFWISGSLGYKMNVLFCNPCRDRIEGSARSGLLRQARRLYTNDG